MYSYILDILLFYFIMFLESSFHIVIQFSPIALKSIIKLKLKLKLPSPRYFFFSFPFRLLL